MFPKNFPQMEHFGIDEFLKLDLRQTNLATVRNRTKRAAVMRRGSRPSTRINRSIFGFPEKRLRFWAE
jgi:hypothetical protein